MEFVVAAFNAHWGVGRFDAERLVPFDVATTVKGFDADIVVVPEAFRDDDGMGVLDPLCAEGYDIQVVRMMPLALRPRNRNANRDGVPRHGTWELAVCSRSPVLGRREIPIGVIPDDPAGLRNALAVTVDIGGTAVEVVGVHTSSKVWKLAPVRHLLELKRQLGPVRPQIIAGDFNFWGPPVGLIMRGWKRPVRGRTYPSRRPHSQIDHVLVRGGVEPVSGEVLGATLSDHLPVRARLRVGNGVT